MVHVSSSSRQTQLATINILLLSFTFLQLTTNYYNCLKSTVCSIHFATVNRFLSDKYGPINCKLSGNSFDDNLIGIETAGIPVKKVKVQYCFGQCTITFSVLCSDALVVNNGHNKRKRKHRKHTNNATIYISLLPANDNTWLKY